MGWLQRLLGGARSEPAEKCLSGAGPPPGRAHDISRVEQALRQFGPPDAARQFLAEHYGQAVEVPIAGGGGITGLVHFDPELVLRLLGPADLPRLAALMPNRACPVGTTGGHTVFVFMD